VLLGWFTLTLVKLQLLHSLLLNEVCIIVSEFSSRKILLVCSQTTKSKNVFAANRICSWAFCGDVKQPFPQESLGQDSITLHSWTC